MVNSKSLTLFEKNRVRWYSFLFVLDMIQRDIERKVYRTKRMLLRHERFKPILARYRKYVPVSNDPAIAKASELLSAPNLQVKPNHSLFVGYIKKT